MREDITVSVEPFYEVYPDTSLTNYNEVRNSLKKKKKLLTFSNEPQRIKRDFMKPQTMEIFVPASSCIHRVAISWTSFSEMNFAKAQRYFVCAMRTRLGVLLRTFQAIFARKTEDCIHHCLVKPAFDNFKQKKMTTVFLNGNVVVCLAPRITGRASDH